MNVSAEYDAIYARIRTSVLRLRDSRYRRAFGSRAHDYELYPALSEDAVAEFESKRHIKLPLDYRGFLINVGNGGAGPAYGVFKLGEMDGGRHTTPWRENDGLVGTLSNPFPLSRPWNDLTNKPIFDDSREQDLAYEDQYSDLLNIFDKTYWTSENVNGAIPLCDEGCAYRLWLIVTGPEAGNIWCDGRVNYKGLFPLQLPGRIRVTFLQWYMNWLDEALINQLIAKGG